MKPYIRPYQTEDILFMMEIWNEVVKEGVTFPQTEEMTLDEATEFFAAQTLASVAIIQNEVVGLYILHPNNVGRCGHIGNCSYAVRANKRGLRFGEALVIDSLRQAKQFGFHLIQFNAVVRSNKYAIQLYEKLGFIRLGIIPDGFKMKDGSFEDILLFYYPLDEERLSSVE